MEPKRYATAAAFRRALEDRLQDIAGKESVDLQRVRRQVAMAARTLRLSSTYVGAQFRRLRTKLGAPGAIKAMAAKLARLVYRMLRYGMKYVDQGAEFYEAQHRKRQINHLKWKAAKLGFQIVEAAAA